MNEQKKKTPLGFGKASDRFPDPTPTASDTLGPGSYENAKMTSVVQLIDSRIGSTLGPLARTAERFTAKKTKVPGPGTYERPKDTEQLFDGKWRDIDHHFEGTRLRDTFKNNSRVCVPGPGAYHSKEGKRDKRASAAFGVPDQKMRFTPGSIVKHEVLSVSCYFCKRLCDSDFNVSVDGCRTAMCPECASTVSHKRMHAAQLVTCAKDYHQDEGERSVALRAESRLLRKRAVREAYLEIYFN